MREKIMSMVKEAMKSGDKGKLSALRLMQSAIKDKDIEVRVEGRTQITEDEIMALFQKMVKQRLESLKMYQDAGRTELAAQEQLEIDVIQGFLPKQMSEGDLKVALQSLISEVGATSMKDIGKVMPALKAKYAGQLDMGKANGLLKELLGG